MLKHLNLKERSHVAWSALVFFLIITYLLITMGGKTLLIAMWWNVIFRMLWTVVAPVLVFVAGICFAVGILIFELIEDWNILRPIKILQTMGAAILVFLILSIWAVFLFIFGFLVTVRVIRI